MAFWGVEVKPGKPFTHIADNAKDRLHISQATLGTGTATKKSVVQCNVGNKSPVFLCSLFPEKAESCQLNLEFEEANEVVFSVIGPRSVHLTGYFLGSGGRYYNLNDESESFGEDIADTETERSTGHSDEDKYEDSFIDDSDPKLFPPSPLSDDKVQEFETPEKRKPKNVKESRKRLRKKYQLSETDDDVDSQEHTNANGTTSLDSDGEDMLPISSLCMGSPATRRGKLEDEKFVEENGNQNPATKNGKFESEEKPVKKSCGETNSDSKDEEFCFTIMEKKVDDFDTAEPKRLNSGDSVLPAVEVIPENSAKPKKKKKEQSKDGKYINSNGCCDVLKEDKAHQIEAEAEQNFQNLPVRNEENEKNSYHDSGADLPPDSMPPSAQTGPESDAKPKKRKRKDSAEKKFAADSHQHTNVIIENMALQDEVKPNSTDQDLPARNDVNMKQAHDKIFDNDVVKSADENKTEEKRMKKKKRKTGEDARIVHRETPLVPMDEKSGLVPDAEKSSDSKLLQLRTLSNGVVIQELEKGKSDGKVATSGKKISVLYTGKLKENGQVFDSNLGGAPFKFRLGGTDVLDGFNVGLEGMRVGEKRRIILPPSMGYGSEGDCKNVPPNASLVFDVELVKIHK